MNRISFLEYSAQRVHFGFDHECLLTACAWFTSGVTAAKGGTLTFMVGGKEEAYERAAKILQHMGKNVIHTGITGTGQVIFNQSIVNVANQLRNHHNHKIIICSCQVKGTKMINCQTSPHGHLYNTDTSTSQTVQLSSVFTVASDTIKALQCVLVCINKVQLVSTLIQPPP